MDDKIGRAVTRRRFAVPLAFFVLLALHFLVFELRYAWFPTPGETIRLRGMFAVFALAMAANLRWSSSALLAFALSVAMFAIPPLAGERYVSFDAGFFAWVTGVSAAWAALAHRHATMRRPR